MSFGRKGMDAGATFNDGFAGLRNSQTSRGSNAIAGSSHDHDMARKREAFIASERARNTDVGGAGLSAAVIDYKGTGARPERSLFMAYMLWFILGQVSAHRFYLGAFRSALCQVGLFVLWVALALAAPEGSAASVGPILAIALIGWSLWILADVFFIHRIHRKNCRRPGEVASVFA